MRPARERTDPFTGQKAHQLHHVMGRDDKGTYIAPQLVVPLTVTQHNREHQSWPGSYAEGASEVPTVLGLQRLANFLIRLGQQFSGGVVTLEAGFLLEAGLTLHQFATESTTEEGKR